MAAKSRAAIPSASEGSAWSGSATSLLGPCGDEIGDLIAAPVLEVVLAGEVLEMLVGRPECVVEARASDGKTPRSAVACTTSEGMAMRPRWASPRHWESSRLHIDSQVRSMLVAPRPKGL